MDLSVRNTSGGAAAAVQVSDRVFNSEFKPALVHQVVTAYLAGARAGTNRSPLWRGGGRVFAAVPRDFSQKVNRKMYRGAVRSILSELVRQERLVVVEQFGVATPKTKELAQKLAGLGLKDVLLVTDAFDENLYLAARNLAGVDVLTAQEADPVSLVAFEKVLVTEGAVKQFEERLA